MKKYLLISFSVLASAYGYSQGEQSSFTSTGRGGVATTFASDYEAIGLNPANIGMAPKYEGKNVAIGLTEFGASIYSEALAKPDLRGMLFGFADGGTELTKEQKNQAAVDFIQSPLVVNVDILNIGFSVYSEKVGGIGFTVKDRISWYSSFNSNFSEILFKGSNASYFDKLKLNDGSVVNNDPSITDTLDPNKIDRGFVDSASAKLMSDIFDGTRMTLNWYKEYNLTYGRGFTINDNFKLYGGIGLKMIQGIASLDVNVENGDLSKSYGSISAGIPVNYGDFANNPFNNLDTVNNGMFGLPEATGRGFGADLGFNILLGKFDIGIAMTDIGSINYTKNIYSVDDVRLVDIGGNGLNTYNIFQGAAESFSADEGTVEWENLASKKVLLPTVLRTGLSFTQELTDDRKVEFGADIIMPMNDAAGNYKKTMIGLGGDISLLKWLNISSGVVVGGTYGFNVPFGITLDFGNGTYEMGVASRDIYTFFANNGPTLSMSTGFLRFRF